MLAVNAIYDGKKIKLLEKPAVKATTKMPRRAIITFLDDDDTVVTETQRRNLAKSKKDIAKGNYSSFVKLKDV